MKDLKQIIEKLLTSTNDHVNITFVAAEATKMKNGMKSSGFPLTSLKHGIKRCLKNSVFQTDFDNLTAYATLKIFEKFSEV